MEKSSHFPEVNEREDVLFDSTYSHPSRWCERNAVGMTGIPCTYG